MADKVRVELVTPSRLLVAEEADMVVVPGGEGDFGVLPGHAPLLSTVRPGVVDVYRGDKIARRVFVEGGFAEVLEGRCTVLADAAVPVQDIAAEAAEGRLQSAKTALAAAGDEAARNQAEAELRIAEAMTAAAEAGAKRP